SAVVTDQEIRRHLQLENERRRIGYFTLPLNSYLEKTSPGEEEIQAWYEQHAADYRTPEQISVEYVELKLEDMASRVEVSDEELSSYYEQHLENYISQPERRKVRHILIQVDAGTDDAKARARAEQLAQRLREGADFSELARSGSDDSVSAEQGGDLGFISQGMMDKAFEQAAFRLKPGEVSPPVRSKFGYHLIRVDEIQPARVQSLAEVRDQIRKELQSERAETRFYESVDKLNNLSYEIPDSLTPVAEELGLEVKHSPLFPRSGGSGLFANPRVVSAAFRDEVLQEHRNSELVEISDTHMLVLRLREHKPGAQRPLAEVRAGIEARLKQDKARQLAMQDATRAVTQLEAGDTPADVAATFGQPWREAGFIGRMPVDTDKLDNRLRAAVFRMPPPAPGKVVFRSVALPGGDLAILALYEVEPGKVELTPEVMASVWRKLGTAEGQAMYNAFLAYLESMADISRNLKPVEE
ncbi:MAG TPA: hypothetical protein EYP40_11305, partial [Chromatiales bacterium]|nr:hypothetical protein [Chromatiales bacterium]